MHIHTVAYIHTYIHIYIARWGSSALGIQPKASPTHTRGHAAVTVTVTVTVGRMYTLALDYVFMVSLFRCFVKIFRHTHTHTHTHTQRTHTHTHTHTQVMVNGPAPATKFSPGRVRTHAHVSSCRDCLEGVFGPASGWGRSQETRTPALSKCAKFRGGVL
jgi:hypothetical protein